VTVNHQSLTTAQEMVNKKSLTISPGEANHQSLTKAHVTDKDKPLTGNHR